MNNKDIKIRIPCEAVSEAVQKKMFGEGYEWYFGDGEVRHLSKPHLYTVSEGKLLVYSSDEDGDEYFNDRTEKEVSWQEYLYGEGYFFKLERSDIIYFQAKNTSYVHFVDEGDLHTNRFYQWEEDLGEFWTKCDMFGNEIKEEKQMKKQFTKDMLQAGKHIVEFEGGKLALVMGNNTIHYLKDLNNTRFCIKSFDLLDTFDDSLLSIDEYASDIMKVYELDQECLLYPENKGKLVWEREEEAEELIVKQIEDLPGKKIKVVADE